MRILPAGAAETPLVELRALTKSYPEGGGERVVFRDLSVGIRRGETIALLGRSGSGKSTLLNLIGGIDLPTAGEVILDGTNLTGLSEQRRTLFRRRHIGLVFQSFNLIPTLTVMENLLLPLELNGKTGARPLVAAKDLLERVGLADRAGAYPDRLSGNPQDGRRPVRLLDGIDPGPEGSVDPGNLSRNTRHLLIGPGRFEGPEIHPCTRRGRWGFIRQERRRPLWNCAG